MKAQADNIESNNEWEISPHDNHGLVQGCYLQCINTLRQRQNGRHFADDTYKRIF